MKKIICILAFLTAIQALHAQSFLNKIKNKINKPASPQTTTAITASATGSSSSSGIKYTDPSVCGTVIKTFSQKEVEAHMGGESGGGFNLYFPSIKVVNNQLQFKVADHVDALYDYTNGQLQNTGSKPAPVQQYKIYNGSEKDLQSKDFSNFDAENAMLKKGPHIQSGRAPGKIDQAFTFNGKSMGSYVTGFLAHNADSTVVAATATVYGTKGVGYLLVSSNGQKLTLPVPVMMSPLISPDGKFSAAMSQTAAGVTFYVSDGSKVSVNAFANDGIWLRNSGSIFSIDNGHRNALYKNGAVYNTINTPIDLKNLFISSDDKSMCWAGDHGLYFSDGTIFENASSPHKLVINNKEVIVFLDVDIKSGQVYLCKHDL
jgi:hypothetical protein